MSDNNQQTNQSDYFACVCIDEAFAYEMWQKGIAVGKKLSDDVYNRDDEWPIFTHNVFPLVKHNNINAAYDTIKYHWDKSFPDAPDKFKVIVTKNNHDEASEYLKKMFISMYGTNDYLRLCTEIKDVLPVMKERDLLHNFMCTNYLVAANPGCGFSEIARTLYNLLKKLELFETPNKNNIYWDFVVGERTENGRHSVDDILDIIREEDNKYTTVALDICYFLDKNKHPELRNFLRLLNRYQDDYIFLFRVPFLEKDALRDIREVLSDIVNIKEIVVTPPSDIVLLDFLVDKLSCGQYHIDNDAIKLYFNKIKEEKRDGRFYGFKTAEKICNEICWLKAKSQCDCINAGSEPNKRLIEAKDIENLCGKIEKDRNGYDMLNELIGMESIAEQIKQIVAQVKLSISNKTFDRPCIHMRFLGAPGTGKTTVARIIGKILKDEKILSKGEFIECSARSLCGEYIGQTAPRTAAVCRDAYGSVLFIDEAYSLYTGEGSGQDYGREALATLIAEMENHRDDMVVIMAGYTDDMNTLMKGNAGLRSRMPYMLDFKTYTRTQLYEIFMLMVSKHFRYTQEFSDTVKAYFDILPDSIYNSKEFANARFVRNLYERTWSKAALRITFSSKSINLGDTPIIDKYSLGDEGIILVAEDFRSASSEKEFSENLGSTIAPVGFKK